MQSILIQFFPWRYKIPIHEIIRDKLKQNQQSTIGTLWSVVLYQLEIWAMSKRGIKVWRHAGCGYGKRWRESAAG